jgi:N-acetylmuramic acid 6-phosphate etherase
MPGDRLYDLATEARAAGADYDERSTLELVQLLNEADAAVPAVVGAAAAEIAAVVDAVADRLARGGRLVYVGAGSSARIATQDAAELLPTFGWPSARVACLIAGGPGALLHSVEGAEDDVAAGTRDAAALGPGPEDVVLAVAASGITPYTRAAQAAARRAGTLTVAFANNPDAPLLAEADHPVLLRTGPEFLPGSTRLGAGTAQKVALNLFSTQLMARLGRVYRGRMVGLVPGNAKLLVRARRIVAELAGCAPEAAAAALEAAGRDVRLAILMLDGLPQAEAQLLLDTVGGDLGRARALAASCPPRLTDGLACPAK